MEVEEFLHQKDFPVMRIQKECQQLSTVMFSEISKQKLEKNENLIILAFKFNLKVFRNISSKMCIFKSFRFLSPSFF